MWLISGLLYYFWILSKQENHCGAIWNQPHQYYSRWTLKRLGYQQWGFNIRFLFLSENNNDCTFIFQFCFCIINYNKSFRLFWANHRSILLKQTKCKSNLRGDRNNVRLSIIFWLFSHLAKSSANFMCYAHYLAEGKSISKWIVDFQWVIYSIPNKIQIIHRKILRIF